MVDNPTYREWLEELGLSDINEILSKNDYQSPEESDPENNPNSSAEQKRIFVYKLPWRTEKVSQNNNNINYMYLLISF
jgi:hypothetical protein